MRDEEEDGGGWDALVPTREERAAAMATTADIDEAEQLAYAEGRKDEREATLAEFAALLPGPIYMDPPDGGSVPVQEQFRRMAEDARRWREHQEHARLAIECEMRCEG